MDVPPTNFLNLALITSSPENNARKPMGTRRDAAAAAPAPPRQVTVTSWNSFTPRTKSLGSTCNEAPTEDDDEVPIFARRASSWKSRAQTKPARDPTLVTKHFTTAFLPAFGWTFKDGSEDEILREEKLVKIETKLNSNTTYRKTKRGSVRQLNKIQFNARTIRTAY